MRALSVKQPWAELIARGQKKKEFRTWSRSCFGELLIVASKAIEADDIADARLDATSLVFGRAVCVVDFYKVTGDEGDYAWHLRNPRRVESVEVRGSASLYHVPDERVRFVAHAKRVPPEAVRIPPRKGAKAKAPRPSLLEPKKRPPAPNCPTCGSSNSIPIEYGYPSPEMWEGEKRGELEIGGCCIGPGEDPAWRCRKCGVGHGRMEDDADTSTLPRAARSKPKRSRRREAARLRGKCARPRPSRPGNRRLARAARRASRRDTEGDGDAGCRLEGASPAF